jgi:hypothetical protein
MPLLLENRVFRNERIVLDQPNLNALSVGLVLQHCELDIRVPAKRLSIHRVVIEDCVVRTKSPLANFQGWLSCEIRRTRFLGTFKGNDFGSAPWEEVRGVAEALDFSGAVLDSCQMIGSDVEGFVWPTWPNFTIIDPLAHADELTPPFASWFPERVQQPPALSALCFYAPKQLKYLADKSMTVEQLRDALPNAPWLKR